MTGLTQLINIGLSGLSAATEGMQTVSNNTSNVNTPGYDVESLNQVALPGSGGPPGNVGTGANVTSIARGFDQFIFNQLVQATSANQAAQTIQTNASSLASIFPIGSGGAGGLGQALDTFFAAASDVSQDPTSQPNRQTFLSDAQSLTSTFNSIGAELTSALATENGEIGGAVGQINTLTQQIASLNQSIMAQTGAGALPSNDLLDQRDALVQQLGQDIGLTVVQGNNNAVDLYTNSGAALVTDANSFGLQTTSGGYGDGNITITYQPTGQDLTNSISGGTLGGLLSFRTQITNAQDTVGAVAVSLSQAVNAQQSLGLDLNGNLGQALFSVGAPVVYASQSNTGSGTLTASISNTNNFVPGDFIITKTASGFSATNMATGQNTMLGSGSSFSFDGMTVAVSGTVQVGDSFKLEPTASAAQGLSLVQTDPNAVAAASPYVATAGVLGSGGSILDRNSGNVQATAGSPTTSGSLPAGTVIVPSSYFGQDLSIAFTSSASFNVVSSAGSVIASGSFSGTSGAEIAIAYPSPPAAAGSVATVSLSPGTPATGDSFALTPGGIGSNGNIVALAGLETQNLLSGQTLGNTYANLVTAIGNRGQEAKVAAQASQAVLTRAQTTQQSVSGVNLDEEAANLVSYQQAYQASAEVIASAQTMFQTLISIF